MIHMMLYEQESKGVVYQKRQENDKEGKAFKLHEALHML